MCGISGFFSPDGRPATEILACLAHDIVHRGPNDEGLWTSADGRMGFGHRRLSIIDLSPAGHQPMSSASGRYVIAFNGEIYNFGELRRELTALGHCFRGASDTEVMLAGFEQWGIPETVVRLDGMFAAAVADTLEKTLYLFRDRLGVKPLYFQWTDGMLFFSSELTRAFARLGDRVIDRSALALYLQHGYIPAPHSIYMTVRKLLPGILAIVTPESGRGRQFAKKERYWDAESRIRQLIAERDESMDAREAVERIESALRKSVKHRMISDVPLGAFLSGGIDSSLVVSHMQELSTRPVRTFTIGFTDEERDESRFAAEIAKHLGTEHTELRASDADALEVVPQLPAMFGEPFADSSQIPTFLVSRLARRSITVVLSGDGGDELFAGYWTYGRMIRLGRYIPFVPARLYRTWLWLAGNAPIGNGVRFLFGEGQHESLIDSLGLLSCRATGDHPNTRLRLRPLAERMVRGSEPLISAQELAISGGNAAEDMMTRDLTRYLPDDILTKVDRCSMAVSLEVRAPFTDDHELFDAAWSIPFRHKANAQGGKIILKEALSRHVPKRLFDRPKKGFGVPLISWLQGPLKTWVRDCLDPSLISRTRLLDPIAVARILDRAGTSQWYATKLWYVCIFQSWITDFHEAH